MIIALHKLATAYVADCRVCDKIVAWMRNPDYKKRPLLLWILIKEPRINSNSDRARYISSCHTRFDFSIDGRTVITTTQVQTQATSESQSFET